MGRSLARDLVISNIVAVLVKAKKQNIEVSTSRLIAEISSKYNVSGTTARDYLNVALSRLRNIGIMNDRLS